MFVYRKVETITDPVSNKSYTINALYGNFGNSPKYDKDGSCIDKPVTIVDANGNDKTEAIRDILMKVQDPTNKQGNNKNFWDVLKMEPVTYTDSANGLTWTSYGINFNDGSAVVECKLIIEEDVYDDDGQVVKTLKKEFLPNFPTKAEESEANTSAQTPVESPSGAPVTMSYTASPKSAPVETLPVMEEDVNTDDVEEPIDEDGAEE